MSEKEAIVLLLMSLGAYIIPFTSKRLYLPSSVGEIIYGMILAFFVTTSSSEPMLLVEYFSTFGFLLLMYIAGLELDFDKFRTLKKIDIALYFIMYIPIIAVSFCATQVFNLHWSFMIIFSATGIGLLFAVLKETGLIKTGLGQNMLIIGMIGEIFTLLGLTVVTMIKGSTASFGLVLNILYIVIFFVAVYLALKILKVMLWWYPTLQSLFLRVGNSTETGIRANFAILFLFVAFAAVLKIEFVVGAFIGGMMFALIFHEKDAVLEKLNGVAHGFFIPIFFISVGTKLSFSSLLDINVIKLSLIIMGVLFVVKLIGSLTLIFTNIKNSYIIIVAMSLSMPLTILVALGTVLSAVGVLTNEQSSAVLIASIFSAIIYPWIFKILVTIFIPELDESK